MKKAVFTDTQIPVKTAKFSFLAERKGLEPSASGVTGPRYNRLHYRSALCSLNTGNNLYAKALFLSTACETIFCDLSTTFWYKRIFSDHWNQRVQMPKKGLIPGHMLIVSWLCPLLRMSRKRRDIHVADRPCGEETMIQDEAGLARQAALGEDSRHRFQGEELEEETLAREMAALANSAGGEIFLGLAEDGSMPGLSATSIARVNKTLARAARSLEPPLVVRTQNILLKSGRVVIVVEVPVSRRLVLDESGKVWVKVAAGRVAQGPDEAGAEFRDFSGRESPRTPELARDRDVCADTKASLSQNPETVSATRASVDESCEKNFSSFDPESSEGEEAREVYRLIANDKFVTVQELARQMDISKRTVNKRVALLKDLGAIIRRGSSRAGHWVCVPERAVQRGICAPEAAKAVDDAPKNR